VIPAFESGCNSHLMSRNNRDHQSKCYNDEDIDGSLLERIECGLITPFHVSHFPAGHKPTNFERWKSLTFHAQSLSDYNSDLDEIGTYSINYQDYFEPYVIVSRRLFFPYDERFRGYGMNKCIHLKAMQLISKGTFRVVPKQYLISPCHDRSLSHQMTYSPQAILRRVIIAKLYKMSSNELRLGVTPTLSETSKQLFSNCWQHHSYNSSRSQSSTRLTIPVSKSNLPDSQSVWPSSLPSLPVSLKPFPTHTSKLERFCCSSLELFSQKLQKIFSNQLSRFETKLLNQTDKITC